MIPHARARARRFASLAAAVGSAVALAAPAPAPALEIVAAVRGTALDAQYDGVFEDLVDATLGGEFATVTMGRVLGSFESERRAILEFAIGGLAPGTPLASARLAMDFVSGSTPRGAYFFYGYEGDGLLSFGDSDRTQDLVTSQSGAGFSVDVDVTDFVQGLVDAGVDWAGFVGVEVVDEIVSNFIAGPRDGRTMPTLVIDLPAPGPAGAAAALAALLALGRGRRRRGAARRGRPPRCG